MTRQVAIGKWGEAVAGDYLRARGYEILACNARTPYGELDLVARQGETIVFVEVKTRTNLAFGLPEEAVTVRKRAHLLDSAAHYLQTHPELDGDWRVDVIAILGRPGAVGTQIEWFQNAIS